jgi:hypothetical protein
LPENEEGYMYFRIKPEEIAKSMDSVVAALSLSTAASTEDSLYKKAQS